MYFKDQELNYSPNTKRPMEKIADVILLDILTAKSVGMKIKTLQKEALEEIVSRYSNPTLDKSPLQKQAKLALLGKTTFKITNLKEKLQVLGIPLSNQIEEDTTHILIGQKLSSLDGFKGKTILLEQDLQKFLDQEEKPYLQQEEQKGDLENIIPLLHSEDKNNQQLAVSLMQGGGFPKELINHVFVAIKTTQNPKIRTALKKILIPHLSTEGQARLSQNYGLTTVLEEFTVVTNILKYTLGKKYKKTPVPVEFDGLEIARILFKYYQVGFLYLWIYSKDQEEIKESLTHFIQGNQLDLSSKGVSCLPDALADFPTLETIILNYNYELKKLPEVLTKLPNLHTLKLIGTFINITDLSFPKIKNLQELEWSGSGMDLESLGEIELPQLKILRLDRNSSIREKRLEGKFLPSAEKDAVVSQLFPNCKIEWFGPA